MKIVVEVEDNVYRALKRFYGEEIDIADMLASVLREFIVMFATHLEETLEMFGPEKFKEQPQFYQDALKRIFSKIDKPPKEGG